MTRRTTASAAVLIAALALAPSALAQVPAAQPTPTGMTPALEQCIRGNAAAVERGVADLAAATSFLVEKVCAQEASEDRITRKLEFSRAMSAQLLESLKVECDTHKQTPAPAAPRTVQPAAPTGEATADVDPCEIYENTKSEVARQAAFERDAVTQAMMLTTPDVLSPYYGGPDLGPLPSATALAAKLLLERRIARSGGR